MNLNVWIEEKRKVLGNIASEHHQKILHERKIKKVYIRKNKKISLNLAQQPKSLREINVCAVPLIS